MARIEKVVLRCDQCGKMAEHQTFPIQYGGVPFNGWIKNVNNVVDFCSPRCAEKYFADWDNK